MSNKQTKRQERVQAAKTMAANGKDRLKQTGRRITAKQKQIISSMYRPLCRIFILIGIATLLLAVVVIWQYRSSTQRTAKTTGVITEIDKVNGIGRDEPGDNAQKCRIGYKVTIDGNEYTDVLGYRGDPTTDKCQLFVGQVVEINYDPSHPSNNAYVVDDETSDHGTLDQTISSATGIAVVGLIPLAIGIVGLRIARSRQEDTFDDETSDTTSKTKPKSNSKPSAKANKKQHKED